MPLSKGFSLLLDNENGDPTRCNASGPPDHEERLASLMAGKNPRVGARVVPFDLPDTQVAILRDDLLGWLYGADQDPSIRDARGAASASSTLSKAKPSMSRPLTSRTRRTCVVEPPIARRRPSAAN
jgi:hypothetical protein